jgi:predicted Zn-dependent peptidase
VTADDVAAAAAAHIHPDELAIVLVGDADAFLADLEAADLGPIEVEREAPPPTSEVTDDQPG